ncbi:MAG: hypothetical protein RRZ24_01995 [Clostridia bacterium]
MLQNEVNNSIWDSSMDVDGKLYMSISSELQHSGYARLYEFDYHTNRSKKLMEVEKVILPQDRAIRASKFHTSISFMNNGKMVMTTHSTDKAPQHPTWLPESFYGSMWEGFAGSNIITYDRETGEAQNLGIPAPHESLYGSIYDPRHNALYSLGYMRGHLYRYSFDEKNVKDLGKVSEAGSFRMVLGPDGNIYSSSKSGYMFKIDTNTQTVIDLNYRVPFYYYGNDYTFEASFGNIADGRIGPDGRLYFSIMYGPDFIALDTKTGKIENMGPYLPTSRYAVTENRNGVFGFDFDSKGVMWYYVSSVSDGSVPEQPAQPASLFKWDIIHGGRPQWVGILGTKERIAYVASELYIHEDHLMVVETNHADECASVITIDLQKFEPTINEMKLVDPETLHDNMFKPGNPAAFGYSRLFDKQGAIAGKNPHTFDGKLNNAYRIWRELAPDNIENSAVTGIVWDEKNTLYGICGKEKEFVFQIADGTVISVKPILDLDAEFVSRLRKAVIPMQYDGTCQLPSYPGRQYKAVTTACAELTGGRKLVGTLDGLLAICKGNQAYALGMAGYNGPVRAMSATPDKKTVYGVAGDDEDFGMVFQYDDVRGLQLKGDIKHGSSRGSLALIACNVLSCCAVSNDGKYLAIASADRLGTVVIYNL